MARIQVMLLLTPEAGHKNKIRVQSFMKPSSKKKQGPLDACCSEIKKVLFKPQRTLSPGLNKSALVILMEIIFLPEPRAELSKHLSKLVLGKEENPARLD